MLLVFPYRAKVQLVVDCAMWEEKKAKRSTADPPKSTLCLLF